MSEYSEQTMPSLLSPDHNSDLRDSHECLEKQVWVAWILTRQSSRRLGLERTKLTAVSVTVCFNSAHPTYILKRLGYTKMSLKSELCDTRDTSQISCGQFEPRGVPCAVSRPRIIKRGPRKSSISADFTL